MSDPTETIHVPEHFDPDWYRARYPDVALSGMDPAEHFARYGRLLERKACPDAPVNKPNSQLLSEDFMTPRELAVRYLHHPLETGAETHFPDLVSIIIPSFNNGGFLRAATHSALSQTGANVEVIVVDDGSSDNSLSVANQIAERDARVRVISLLRNFGCYYARNIGVMEAKGAFIAFLDSDDILHPERLLRQLDALMAAPSAWACLCQLRRWTKYFEKPLSNLKHGENTILLHRKVFDEIGFFDSVRFSADAEFRKRLQRKLSSHAIAKIDDELCFLRTLETSLTMQADSRVFQREEHALSVNISPARSEYEKRFLAWHKAFKEDKRDLFVSFPQFRRPFDLYDGSQSASPSMDEAVIGTMATYPPREAMLRKTLPTILPQLDRLVVYLNNYEEVPDFLRDPRIETHLGINAAGDLRDNGKFYSLSGLEGYIFTLDDDILYPHDYVRRMVHYVEMFQRSCVLGVHGVIYPEEKMGYMEDRTVMHFADKGDGRFVDSVGTGTAAFHSSCLDLTLDDFRTTGVCDLWFASACHRRAVPLIAVPRAKRWLRQTEAKNSQRLYDEAKNNGADHTKLYHANLYPILARENPRLRSERALLKMRGRAALHAAGIECSAEAAEEPVEQSAVHHSRPFLLHTREDGPKTGAGCVRMHVLVNGWNCADYVHPCLRSLANQHPGRYVADFTLIDDGSTDATFEKLSKTDFLPGARLIRNNANYGPAYARHIGITRIADPDTVVVLVDLDDELKPDALKRVAERYLANRDCLMTIGNWHSQHGRLNPHPFYSADVIDRQEVREVEEFLATHLRSFKRKLYDAVEKDDLLGPEGEWLQTCTDVAIMYPLLDQCYARNVEFIDRPIYLYNKKHGLGTLSRFGKPHKKERLQWLKNKPRKPRFGGGKLSATEGIVYTTSASNLPSAVRWKHT